MNQETEQAAEELKKIYTKEYGEEVWWKMIGDRVRILKNYFDLSGVSPEQGREDAFRAILIVCAEDGADEIEKYKELVLAEVAFDVFLENN